MFKVGDKVIVIDNTNIELSFNIGDEFIVNRCKLLDDHYCISITEDYYCFYDTKFFMTFHQLRKEKIKKLEECSSQ